MDRGKGESIRRGGGLTQKGTLLSVALGKIAFYGQRCSSTYCCGGVALDCVCQRSIERHADNVKDPLALAKGSAVNIFAK